VSTELEHIWSRVQTQLALVVDEPTYRLWLADLDAVEFVDERLLVAVPANAHRWISERFGRVLQASVELAIGPHVQVELLAADGTTRQQSPGRAVPERTSRRQHSVPSNKRSTAPTPDLARAPLHLGPLGNPKLTFDQFVIGDSNRLAHAAALTVAEMPAQAYNPLFIYGPPGVGKTHLMSSIANLLLAHNPELSVRCTTGESFTNEFLAALSDGSTERFKASFRDIDVLLMDDVQFLERKTKTEEEFFHTFNALHDCGRQIVLTSDRPPHDLQALEDRLRERFQAGLVADIAAPDIATRLTILRKRAHHDQIELSDDRALTVVAEHVRSNVRALEGALIRIVAFSSLTGRPLTAQLAQEVLASLYPHSSSPGQRKRTVEEIQSATCSQFGISPDELLSTARTPRVAWPRQLAMYLSRELTEESLPAIGRRFGGRDHTTILHAWRRAGARISSDDSSREAVEKLCQSLNCPPPH
jgi:chromosomal replication initiator protein